MISSGRRYAKTQLKFAEVSASGSDQLLFTCDICNERFSSKDERNAHIENHFKTLKCEKCGGEFVGDRAYEYHLWRSSCSSNSSKEKFRCWLCSDQCFDTKRELSEHERNAHNCIIDTTQIKCGLCNRLFAKLRYLRKHMVELHSNRNHFECEVCGKQFNRKSNLVEHMLIHENKYLAKCETCGKSYRTPSALRLHVRMHTGEKPYKCDLCEDKAYAYNTDLKRHKRYVHGIMGTAHPCSLCSKVYYEPKLLKYHMIKSHQTQSGELNDSKRNGHSSKKSAR